MRSRTAMTGVLSRSSRGGDPATAKADMSEVKAYFTTREQLVSPRRAKNAAHGVNRGTLAENKSPAPEEECPLRGKGGSLRKFLLLRRRHMPPNLQRHDHH